MADDNNLDINIGINPAGAEAGARRVSAAVGGVTQNTKDLDSTFRRLKSAIDPMYAAQDKYNKTLAEYDRLLAAGKLSQQDYAAQVDAITRAYNTQVGAIERNSAAAKRAEVEKQQAIAASARVRETEARAAKAQADAWVQNERSNTTALKRELAEREVAQRAANLAVVAAAREAAAAQAQAMRAGGTPVTKAAETQMIREAAAAAKQANRERLLSEQETDNAILAKYRETYDAAKQLAIEAATVAANAAKTRLAAEQPVGEAIRAANGAEAKEAMQAYRAATVAAAQAAQDRTKAERDLAKATNEERAATEAAAAAAAREARELQGIRASIDPAYAARMRYNETMRQATALLMQNKLATGEWTTIQKQAQIQMDINQRSMGRMNQVGVQLGYQMQDVTASIASGINPLIIFAQQSGQVAYAMQGMGGMAGKVASIMGGVWFQAFTLAVIVLYKYFEANGKAEKSTKDVMVAEDRRKMSVKELTQALMDYTKAQEDANRSTLANNMIQQQATIATQDEVIKKMTTAKKDLANAERELQLATDATGMDESAKAAAIAVAWGRVWIAKRAVTALEQQYGEAVKAQTAAAGKQAQYMSGLTEQETREVMEKDAAYGAFERDYAAAAGNRAKQVQIQIAYQQQLTGITDRYKILKDAESAATRQQAQLEAGVYKSRLDAINSAAAALQKAGFAIPKDHANPNKIGNHPGMGNAAHADHALDVNIPGAGTEANNPIYKKKMDDMVRQYQAAGFRVLWNGKVYNPSGQGPSYDIPANQNQHRDHAHLEAPQSLVGQPKGLGLAKGIAAAENQAIKDLETAEQKAAQALAEAIDTKEAVLADDDTKTNGEKLIAVRAMEAERVAAIVKAYGEQSKQAEQAKQHELQVTKRYNDAIIREEEARAKRVEQLGTINENKDFARDQNRTGMQSDNVDFRESNGLITERQALAEKRQILDQEYQDQITHELAMNQLKMNSLQTALEIPGQEKAHIDDINQQIQQGQAEHLAIMQGLEEVHARNVAKIQQSQAGVTLKSWRDVTTTLTQSLGSNLQQMWMKQQTIGGALLNMADSLVFKFMDMGIQMLQNWVMSQLGMTAAQKTQDVVRTGSAATSAATKQGITAATTAAHVAGEAAQTAASVSGAAAQTGVAAAAGTSEITTNAAVSAAGAFKSTVVIPFIGPVAAPAAAALALAAVLGFASLISAEGGAGEIRNDGQLAMLHKKEMVLPAWIAEPMRKSISAGGGSGGMMSSAMNAGQTVRSFNSTSGDHYNFNYSPANTMQSASMSDMLRRDGQQLRKWIKNEVRNGTLKMG